MTLERSAQTVDKNDEIIVEEIDPSRVSSEDQQTESEEANPSPLFSLLAEKFPTLEIYIDITLYKLLLLVSER